MANIKDDPKVQELLSKAAEKAAKDQEKAIKAETKRALDAIKAVATSEDRDIARHQNNFRKLAIGAVKGE